ncbi:MAG TPA: acyl-homoserine-lactone synthase [Rhizomicrobium sp.]|jgi:acyl homoserine lactone synthase|nr:acyl-homoserine-lactone synthase [Rhizomicrobium sp.]
MLQLITNSSYADFADALVEMFQLRARVFSDRLGWEVSVIDGMEKDRYDDLKPAYLLQRDRDGRVCGCVRLLPTTGPTMLRDTFPQLLHGAPMPCDARIWETSRFAIDAPAASAVGAGGAAILTYELFAGVVEFGLANNLTHIVTVTDARLERILRRSNWPLQRMGDTVEIGDTRAVAGLLDISSDVLARLRSRSGLKGPVLWVPVSPTPSA